MKARDDQGLPCGGSGEHQEKRENREMKNIEMKVDGRMLIITVDLTKEFGKSSSGKTTIVATAAGNVTVPGHDELRSG